MQVHTYGNVEFEVPLLSVGTELIIHKKQSFCPYWIANESPRWNVNRFKSPDSPLIIGTANKKICTENRRILDLPIKFPELDTVKLPRETIDFLPEIHEILEFEAAHNPNFDEYYAYLTIDQSWIEAGATQRKPGCHVDGYQGARTTKNERINRSYVFSSGETTEFFLHGFDISHIDDSKYNVFHYMDKLAREEFLWRPREWEIVLMNVYNVHRAPISTRSEYRTFFRLTFDTRKFDRLGNTHNPMFDYNWEMVPRDTQSTLEDYP